MFGYKDNIKYRHEYKYIISSSEKIILEKRLNALIKLDNHNKYIVRSLYFDDYYNRCYFDKENGVEPRAKFRIRTYNNSADTINLELKQKVQGKIFKHKCNLSLEQAQSLMNSKPLSFIDKQGKVLQSLTADMLVRKMKPVVIVEYERTPFVYKYGDVRITIDTNLTASSEIKDFFKQNIARRPVMPTGKHLIEIKFDEYLPDFIYQSLSIGTLQRTTFSKYYLCRKYSM